MTKKLAFKSGDKVVYPGHGVGIINSLITKSIAGSEQQFFDITLMENEMKVMIPVPQAESVGLRKVVDKKAIDEVYGILQKRHKGKLDSQTWNRRFREYSQKLKTGSVYEIAEVLRDLTVLGHDKELSFGEKQMRETAETLLASEIAVSRSRSPEKVTAELRALFG